MKEIHNFPNYFASEKGTIHSYRQLSNGKALKSRPNNSGYLYITLYDKGKKVSKHVHRLVAETLLTIEEGKIFVNHKDGNKLNNAVSNLEWVTQSENEKHAFRTGLKKRPAGDSNPQAKLVEEEVAQIRQLLKEGKLFQREIADMFNVSQSLVSAIYKNKRRRVVSREDIE